MPYQPPFNLYEYRTFVESYGAGKLADFRDERFWKELRIFFFPSGELGVEDCVYWCEHALSLLEQLVGKEHGFRQIDGGGKMTKWSMNAHDALVRRYPEGIFIADGTAGQIDEAYSLGYYDYYQNASPVLAQFYRSGLRYAGML